VGRESEREGDRYTLDTHTKSIDARERRDDENCSTRCEAYGAGGGRHIDRERKTYKERNIERERERERYRGRRHETA
jgi:hypothetical protein